VQLLSIAEPQKSQITIQFTTNRSMAAGGFSLSATFNFTSILHRFGYGFYSTAIKYSRSRKNRQIKANNKSKGDFEDEKDY